MNSKKSASWLEKLGHLFSDEPQTNQELIEVLQEAKNNNLIKDHVLTMLEGALSVSNLKARDIVIPRGSVVVVKLSSDFNDFLPNIIESAHSRYPVVDKNNDVVGILIAKDLLPLLVQDAEQFDWRSILREPFFIPESKEIDVLLQDFKSKHHHMAIVIDEYGKFIGIVTIEDILEQIVGDIDDEHDDEPLVSIKMLPDGDYLVRGVASLVEFNEVFGTKLSGFTNIGEFLLDSFGSMPQYEDQIEIGGITIHVLSVDSKQIQLLRVIVKT